MARRAIFKNRESRIEDGGRWWKSATFYLRSSIFIFLVFLSPDPARAQEPFHKGKTIRIIVGTSPGGGYDTYTRVMARHLGRHIPGNPSIVVDNMPGAGSRILANHLYKVAKPDGLTIGHFVGSQIMQQLLGKPGVEFDASRFQYIGVPAQDNMVFGLAGATGVTGGDQWMASKTAVKIGAITAGDGTYDIPKVLEATIGLPIQLVSGYKGTAPIRLAFNSGEVQGVCNSWESFKATWRKELEARDVTIVLQATPKPHPELAQVPLSIKFAKTEDARKLIEAAVHSYGPTARPYAFPPGTPEESVAILRKAFMDTMRDPEFLVDARKARLDINPLEGSELERKVKEIFKLEPRLVDRLKEILK